MRAPVGEKILAGRYDMVLILLAGPGPIMEFGMFMLKEGLAHKFRVYQEAKYKETKSYVNEVVQMFCGRYRQCFVFSSES